MILAILIILYMSSKDGRIFFIDRHVSMATSMSIFLRHILDHGQFQENWYFVEKVGKGQRLCNSTCEFNSQILKGYSQAREGWGGML